MSKYEELCRAYAESVERQGKNINECCEFATFLANGIAQHFELPRAQIGFVTDRHPDRVWQDCNSVVAQLKAVAVVLARAVPPSVPPPRE